MDASAFAICGKPSQEAISDSARSMDHRYIHRCAQWTTATSTEYEPPRADSEPPQKPVTAHFAGAGGCWEAAEPRSLCAGFCDDSREVRFNVARRPATVRRVPNPAERARRLAELDAETLSLQRQEAAIVTALGALGMFAPRRRGADPRAVLMIEAPPAEGKPAANHKR